MLLSSGPDGPFAAVIDTGATGVFLSDDHPRTRALARRRVGGLRLSDSSGNTVRRPETAHVPRLEIGGATFHDFDAIVLPFGPYFDRTPHRPAIQALLGAGLFADCLLTLDLARNTAVVEPPGALPEPDGDDVLPIRLINGCPHVRVRIGKRREWALIDSGFGGAIALSPALARQLPLAGRPVPGGMGVSMFGNARTSIARIDADLRLGRHVVRRPVVIVGKNDDPILIGTDLLRHFTLSIDQRERVARFARPGDEPIDLGGYTSIGFHFARKGPLYAVTDVHPRSGAERAGVRVGDEVVSIGGVAVADLTGSAYRMIVGSDKPVPVRLRRAGAEVDAAVRPVIVPP